MISNFESQISESIDEFLSVFGSQVLVRGVNYLAIFDEAEYEDDSGFRKEIAVSFKKEEVKPIQKGDSIFLNGKVYRVLRIPRATELDPFVAVEVHCIEN